MCIRDRCRARRLSGFRLRRFLDRNCPDRRFRFGGQRDAHLQNAAGKRGLDVLELRAFGQWHGSIEAAVLALAAIEIVLLLFLLAFAFTRDGEIPVSYTHLTLPTSDLV